PRRALVLGCPAVWIPPLRLRLLDLRGPPGRGPGRDRDPAPGAEAPAVAGGGGARLHPGARTGNAAVGLGAPRRPAVRVAALPGEVRPPPGRARVDRRRLRLRPRPRPGRAR